MELSVVIVNFNNGRVLAGCLPSLSQMPYSAASSAPIQVRPLRSIR